MEHRFTDTPDGTSAGAWWATDAASPEVAWLFDAPRQMLIVTTKTGATTEHRIIGKRQIREDVRRKFLPGLALHLSRGVAQPRK